MISTAGSCEGKSSILQTIVQTGLEIILPLKTKTVHPTEPPWISPFLKMIKERQRALSQGKRAEFRHLRNRINRERKVCSSKYNQSRVQHLKECSSAAWWKGIKRLGGITTPFETRGNALKSVHHLKGAGSLTPTELANHISTAFLAPTEGLLTTPLERATTRRVTIQSQQYWRCRSFESCLRLTPPKRRGRTTFQAGY